MISRAGILGILVTFALAVAGCQDSQPSKVAKGADPAKDAGTTGLQAPPMMPKASSPEDAKKEREQLNTDEKSYNDAKATFEKSKSDAKAKETLVDATVKYGTTVMLSSLLSPKEKYPKALHLYREAAKLDPKNKQANENIDLIEGIYKDMGRTIPTD
jgi:hypothetical protein